MEGIVINGEPQPYQKHLIVGDNVGNENQVIDSDEEFLAAAESRCMEELQYCNSFFTRYEDSGFTRYQMKDLFVPGSKLFATMDSKIDLHLKELKSPKTCEEAMYSLCDLIGYSASDDLKGKILKGALKAFDAKSKAIRTNASSVLENLANSDLKAESKAMMIGPLVGAIGRDYYVYDYGTTNIAPALGHIAGSDVSVEKKLKMTKVVMKLCASKNKNVKAEADLSLHFIASSICASDAEALTQLFVEKLEEGNEGMRLAALKGIYGLASSEAAIEVKAGMVDHVIAVLDDKSRDVRLSAVSALAACVQAGLPPDKHAWAMDVMKWLTKSKDKRQGDNGAGDSGALSSLRRQYNRECGREDGKDRHQNPQERRRLCQGCRDEYAHRPGEEGE
jgi:hypothetical protein